VEGVRSRIGGKTVGSWERGEVIAIADSRQIPSTPAKLVKSRAMHLDESFSVVNEARMDVELYAIRRIGCPDVWLIIDKSTTS